MIKEAGSARPKLTEANRELELYALDAALKNEKPGSLKIKIFVLFAYADLNKSLMEYSSSREDQIKYRDKVNFAVGHINKFVHREQDEVKQAKLKAERVFATYSQSRGLDRFNKATINFRPKAEADMYYKRRIEALRDFLGDIRKINKDKARPARNKSN